MTIINDIRACLDYRLNTAVLGSLPIANQNQKFVPTTNQPFLKTTFVPTLRRPAVVGLNPQQRYDGIYNIVVCTPEGEGSGQAYDISDTLLGLFEATTDVFHPNYPSTDVIVHISYSELDNSFLDSPYFCTPINITWYAYH
jgi:hypothetical protein